MDKTGQNKYAQGKIYKLVNDCDSKIYVGSTVNSLRQRKCNHKSDSKRRTQTKYKLEDADYFAVYVAKTDSFYLIPNTKIRSIAIRSPKWTKYKENWDLV